MPHWYFNGTHQSHSTVHMQPLHLFVREREREQQSVIREEAERARDAVSEAGSRL